MKFAAAYLLACLGAEQAAASAFAAAAAAAAEEGAVPVPAPAPAPPAAPTKDDVRRILGSVGAEEADEERLDLLFALMDGKDVAELVAAGRERLAYAPSGAAVVAAAAPAAAAGAGAAAAEEEGKKEEEAKKKEEEAEEEDDGPAFFSLFD